MKNWKRCLSIAMTLVMLVGVLPTAAFAEEGIVPLADPIVVEDLEIAYGEGQATEFTYNGQVQVPQNIVVSSETQKGLTADDYDLVFKKGDTEVDPTTIQDAGTYTIQARLKGNYEGTSKNTLTFTIKPLSFEESAITVANLDITYGDTIKPEVTCKKADESTITLTEDDYAIDYSGTDAGPQTAKVTLKGNYAGEKQQAFTITAKALNAPAIEKIDDQTYTGSAITPAVVVKDGSTVIADSQYTASYDKNTNAGEATVSVVFSHNYTYTGETVSQTFTIKPKDIAGGSMGGLTTAYNPDSRPVPTITVDGKTLVKDTDFVLSHKEDKENHQLTITAEGTGNYTGTLAETRPVVTNSDTTGPLITGVENGKTYYEVKEVHIADTNLEKVEVHQGSSVSTERPEEGKTEITLTLNLSNIPYEIRAYDKLGNATVITVTVTKKTITSDMITIAGADNIVYDGNEKKPDITVKDGQTEIDASHYTLSWGENNTNAGTNTASVTVTMKDSSNYQGSATKTFTIKPKALQDSAIQNIADQVYTGNPVKPTVTVKDGDSITLREGENNDYTVSYTNNINPGTAKVTVVLRGNYTGTLEKTFVIGQNLGAMIENIKTLADEPELNYGQKQQIKLLKAAYDELSDTDKEAVNNAVGATRLATFISRASAARFKLLNQPSIGYYKYTKGTSSNVEIKIDADKSRTEVKEIRIGSDRSHTIDPKYYTVKEGSVIITLNSAYFKDLKLASGTYYVYPVLRDTYTGYEEEVFLKIRVLPATDIPGTGDPFRMTLWVGLLAVSVAGLVGFGVYEVLKKKKNSQKQLEAAMDPREESSDDNE